MLVPLISAIEFDMKSEFDQQETLFAKISGNFVEPILEENIFFYLRHERISIKPNLAKIQNEYYIYAQLPQTTNNYSMVIEDAEYTHQGKIIEEDIVRNFTISGNLTDFSIDKGFVSTNKDFFIEVKNLQDSKLDIDLVLDDYSEKINLNSGQSKKINFKVDDKTEFTKIELSSLNTRYEIPLYIYGGESSSIKNNLRFEPAELNISLATGSDSEAIVYLSNIGDIFLTNISISISDSLKDYISISTQEIEELEEDKSVKIEMDIIPSDEARFVQGTLKAEVNGSFFYVDIYLNFIEDYIPIEEDSEVLDECAKLVGVICRDSEECSGSIELIGDEVCCLGICEETESSSSSGKIIGWIIVIVILGVVVWFFLKKYRAPKKDIDLEKVAKGK